MRSDEDPRLRSIVVTAASPPIAAAEGSGTSAPLIQVLVDAARAVAQRKQADAEVAGTAEGAAAIVYRDRGAHSDG